MARAEAGKPVKRWPRWSEPAMMGGDQGAAAETWTGFRCVLERQQPRLADGRVLGGRSMEEPRMTQLLN